MVESSEILDKALVEVASTGESVRLDSLTDFEWDQVVMVSEGTLAEQVEPLIGGKLIWGERYMARATFLFVDGGEPVAGWETHEGWLSGRYGVSIGRDAVIERVRSDGWLELHD